MEDLDLKKINAMLGISGVNMEEESEDDEQLEAELRAIINGNPAPKPMPRKKAIQNKKISKPVNVLSPELGEDDCDDDSIDENDPELLSELYEIVGKPDDASAVKPPAETNTQSAVLTPVTIQQSSCVILQDSHFRSDDAPIQTKDNKSDLTSGNLIDFGNQVNPKSDSKLTVDVLITWRDGYRRKALEAKKSGNIQHALEYMKQSKVIESAINVLSKDANTDLSTFNLVSPTDFKITINKSESNNSNNDKPAPDVQLNEEENRQIFNAPPPPSSVLEALEQRIAKFQQALKGAENENNSPKVRRLTRIITNYQNAIKAHKTGKPFDYASLPCPPGFAEIPLNQTSNSANNNVKSINPSVSSPSNISNPTQPTLANVSDAKKKNDTEKKISSVAQRQITYLLEKKNQFKKAALEAKQNGDIEMAKDCLRKSKALDPLIEATKNGLPIDTSSIPTLPDQSESFEIISKPNISPELVGDREEIYKKIEAELNSQISVCSTNREYFLKVGNASSAEMFDKYLIEMKKDLAVLHNNWRRGDEVPKFHYEQKHFSIVESNVELSSSHLSVTIISGIDFPYKGNPDTYVKYELPFPKDEPQTGRTSTFKGSRNPDYNHTVLFEIDRKSRTLNRAFKRGLKFEIYLKGGLFKSDQLLGTVNVPLNDLETKCQVFDAFPLYLGRKAIGGQLQIRAKLREPLLAKQIKEIKEKWLFLD